MHGATDKTQRGRLCSWGLSPRKRSHLTYCGVSVIGLEISRRSAAVSRQFTCFKYPSDCTVPLNKVLTHKPVGLSPVSACQRAFSTEEALNDEVARMTQPVSDLGHTSACTVGHESSTYKGWVLMDTYFSVLPHGGIILRSVLRSPSEGFWWDSTQWPIVITSSLIYFTDFPLLSHFSACSRYEEGITSPVNHMDSTQTENQLWESGTSLPFQPFPPILPIWIFASDILD